MIFQANSTVIGLGDGERKFGEAAAVCSKSNFKNTIWGFPRFLGMKQTSPLLKEELKYTPVKCLPTENKGIGFEIRHHGEQKVFTPEQLCGMFISKLQKTYEAQGIACKDIVVSVPPYFSAVERQAMLDAIKISGLNCCKIMNETAAIGLAYGLFRNAEFGDKTRNVVFVDLGYSKLTVSVIQFKSTGFTILAQGYEPNIGSRNMDYIVIEKLAEDFQKKYKKDFRENPKAMVRLIEAMEKNRKILSANIETNISVESVMDDRDIYFHLTRKDFETMIQPIVDKIESLCKKIMDEAKVKSSDIHSIEMVGEATRIPIVMSKIQACIGATTSRTMNSADCVARGCAIQCAMMSPLFKVKDYSIGDFNPYPIEVVYNLPKTDKEAGQKKVRPLFLKGCNFPVTKALSFENRREPLEIQLKYDDPASLALGGPILLGNFRANPEGIPKEDKFTLSVKITLDHNMISSVTSCEILEDYFEEKKVVVKKDVPVQKKPEEKKTEEKKTEPNTPPSAGTAPPPTEAPKPDAKTESPKQESKKDTPPQKMEDIPAHTNAPAPAPVPEVQQEYEIQKVPKKRKTAVDLAFEIHGLSNTKISELTEAEKNMNHVDYLIISTKDAKNSLESYIYEMKAKIPSELKSFVEEGEAQKFMQLLEQAENWLFNEGQNQVKEEYVKRLDNLAKIGDPIRIRAKSFESCHDHGMILSNFIIKTQDFAAALPKDPKYTKEEIDAFNNLLKESSDWLKQASDSLAKAILTKDPPLKDTDYEAKVRKIEDVFFAFV